MRQEGGTDGHREVRREEASREEAGREEASREGVRGDEGDFRGHEDGDDNDEVRGDEDGDDEDGDDEGGRHEARRDQDRRLHDEDCDVQARHLRDEDVTEEGSCTSIVLGRRRRSPGLGRASPSKVHTAAVGTGRRRASR
ncbi:hypothetical protein LL946_11315 [Knoellia locipacati]|uniref:hypothetical protein n=1 Tax=Knoellia locipacati TaxID=882824 RepID=UPI00384F3ADD